MAVLRELLVKGIRADAERQRQGRLKEVGGQFEALEVYRSANPEEQMDRDMCIAHTFWDCWLDQLGHGFAQNFYDGIKEPDWLRLAGEVAGALEANRPIENPLVLKHFDMTGR